jgi:hypothetical protein
MRSVSEPEFTGDPDRLRETNEVLSDPELVRDLQEGLADVRAGRVFSAEQVSADLAARSGIALAELLDQLAEERGSLDTPEDEAENRPVYALARCPA